MDTNFETSSRKEIKYLLFLNETLQAEKLRSEICDEFTRKIFDYLENEPLFDAQVFCAFLYHLIFKCNQYKSVVKRLANPIDKLRLANFQSELFTLLNQFSIKFALPSIDPNLFYGVSIKEKLEHLSPENKTSRKTGSVEIILPEKLGNNDIVPYYDLEFTLPSLSLGQKLDVLHFTICALNYLSQKDDPIEIFSNPETNPHENLKPGHLIVISKILIHIRDSVIKNTIREKAGFGESWELDEIQPDIERILIAQKQDTKIEKQWLDKNSTVFFSLEAKTDEIDLDQKLKITLSARQWLIAFRYFINHYQLRHIDVMAFGRLLAVLNGGKNLHNLRTNLANERSLITTGTREDAQEVADLCREVGLTKIADEIEKAIKQIKPKNL